jgi:predicted AAA+ superfamily ATPase
MLFPEAVLREVEFNLANLQVECKIAMMIARSLLPNVLDLLGRRSSVVLLGPRQVGKTTLAIEISQKIESVYLDLEDPADLRKLADPGHYFGQMQGKLIVIDEVQRMPELFPVIRSQIDRNRRAGYRFGQFLLLGSAANDLLQQTSESLAGRVAYRELAPLMLGEVPADQLNRLWTNGGFPEAWLDPDHSLEWRDDFIRTYLERDIPALGIRIPATTLGRFWQMLAHNHGQLFNASQIGGSLGVKGQMASRYLDILLDLMLVRRLPAWHTNVGKRLIKSPKVYIRDSGILHALLGIADNDDLLGHPIAGASWEGMVIEHLIASAPRNTAASFYRTRAGAEIDLLLSRGNDVWTVEIKRNTAPTLTRGYYHACEDIQPKRKLLIYPGNEQYELKDGTLVSSLESALNAIRAL